MAARLDLPPSTVAAWKRRGSIPDRHKIRIMQTAAMAGIEIELQDFFSADTAQSGAS